MEKPNTQSKITELSGHEAIEYASTHGLTLAKYSDPIEDARDGLTVDEAREIAHEDPGLIYLRHEDTAHHQHEFDRVPQGS